MPAHVCVCPSTLAIRTPDVGQSACRIPNVTVPGLVSTTNARIHAPVSVASMQVSGFKNFSLILVDCLIPECNRNIFSKT